MAALLGLVAASEAAPLFGRPAAYEVDGAPVGVGRLELNGEQGLDIATANGTGADGPSISFLLNRGDGGFLPETRVSVSGFSLQNIATADFDEDGLGDIAVAADIITLPVRGVVLVYLNRGNGELAEPLEYRLPGFFPKCLEVGDVDGDQILDLVACHSARRADDSSEGRITVLVGTPSDGVANGTFRVAFSEVVGLEPGSAAIGRVDADPAVDIVVGDPVESKVSVLFGNGGGFSPALPVGDVDSASSVGIIPLPSGRAGVVATSPPRGRFVVFAQPSSRQFLLLEEHQAFNPTALIAFDFDRNGTHDVAVASNIGGDLWLGAGDGSFEHAEIIYTANSDKLSTIDIAVGDFNGDERPDIAASSSADDLVTVVLNGADVPPTATATPPATDTPTVTNTPANTDTPMRTLTPTRTRTATPTSTGPISTPTPIVTTTPAGPGDANCDGRIDPADIEGLVERLFADGCSAADVNGDGVVNASDMVALLNLLGSRL